MLFFTVNVPFKCYVFMTMSWNDMTWNGHLHHGHDEHPPNTLILMYAEYIFPFFHFILCLYLPFSYRWCWFALWAPSWLWSMNKLFWYIVLLFAELMLLFIQSSVVNCYMAIADCRHYWAVCVYVKLLHNVFALQDVKLFYMLPLQRHRLLSSVHIYIYICHLFLW